MKIPSNAAAERFLKRSSLSRNSASVRSRSPTTIAGINATRLTIARAACIGKIYSPVEICSPLRPMANCVVKKATDTESKRLAAVAPRTPNRRPAHSKSGIAQALFMDMIPCPNKAGAIHK